jgi:hypothetical protein
MTLDHLEDAVDCLQEGNHPHLLIGAVQDNDPRCVISTAIHTKDQLEWFKRRFDEIYAKLEKVLP